MNDVAITQFGKVCCKGGFTRSTSAVNGEHQRASLFYFG